MDCVGQRQKNESQPGDSPSPEQPSSPGSPTDIASKVQLLDSSVTELKQDVQRNVHPQLSSLRFALGDMQAEMEGMVAEVRKKVELPTLLQQFNDRLALLEQKQREQDEDIKLLSEKQQSLQSIEAGEGVRRGSVSRWRREKESEVVVAVADGHPQDDVAVMLKQLQARVAALEEGKAQQQELKNNGTNSSGNGRNAAARPKEVRLPDESPRPPATNSRSQFVEDNTPKEQAIDVDKERTADSDVDLEAHDSRRVSTSSGSGLGEGRLIREVGLSMMVSTGLHENSKGMTKVRSNGSEIRRGSYSSSRTVHGQLPQLKVRAWNESIWEACLLVFVDGLGTGASIHVIFLLLMNIIVQSSFSGVAFYHFTKETFTTKNLEDSRSFRLSMGHNVKFQDTVSKKSLMRRVCEGGFSLDMGTKPGNLVEDIVSYLALKNDDGAMKRFFAGELMCILAIGCWAMVFVAEIDRLFSFCWALASIPLSHESLFRWTPEENLELEGLSLRRYCGAAVLVVVRLFISSILLIVGFMWLTHTVDVETLLLNCVALGFVLDVDLMLFTMAPAQIRAVISKLEPVHVRPLIDWRGADVNAVCLTFFVFLAPFVMFIAFVTPQTAAMRETYDILCNGSLDFVYTQDTIGMTYVSPAFPLNPRADPRAVLARNSVKEVIMHPLDLDAMSVDSWVSTAFVSPMVADNFLQSLYPAEVISGYGVEELVNMINPLCNDDIWDSLPQLKRNFVAILSDFVPTLRGGNPDDLTCAGVADLYHRSDAAGIFVRTICPNIAGCVSPRSPVPSLKPDWGCPTACIVDVEVELLNVSCQDVPNSVLLNSTYWQSWVNHIALMANRVSDLGDNIKHHLLTYGCPGLIGIDAVSQPVFEFSGLCSGIEYNVHPLAHACPVTCGCSSIITHLSLAICPEACVTSFLRSDG